MDPGLLAACGQALHGREWVAPLARDLGVSERTVFRWRAGSHAPADPEAWPRIKAELRAMLAKHQGDTARLIARLGGP